MLQLSDIQSSPEELQEYYAQLRAQHVTPAWIGAGEAPASTTLAGGALVLGALVLNELAGTRARVVARVGGG